MLREIFLLPDETPHVLTHERPHCADNTSQWDRHSCAASRPYTLAHGATSTIPAADARAAEELTDSSTWIPEVEG